MRSVGSLWQVERRRKVGRQEKEADPCGKKAKAVIKGKLRRLQTLDKGKTNGGVFAAKASDG